MSQISENLFPLKLLCVPYKDNEEYLGTEMKKTELLTKYYLSAKKSDDFETIKELAMSDFKEANFFACERLRCTNDRFFMGEYVKNLMELSPLEWFCLTVGLMARADEKYKKMFLKVEDAKKLSYSAILKLYFFTRDITEIKNYYFICSSLAKKMNSLCFNGDIFSIDEYLYQNIMSNACVPVSAEIRLPQKAEPLLIREEVAQKACRFLKGTNLHETFYYCIKGQIGSGKKTLAHRICDILQKSLVTIDAKSMPHEEKKFTRAVMASYREALLDGGFACIENFDYLANSDFFGDGCAEFALSASADFCPVVFLLCGEGANVEKYFENRKFIESTLELPTNEESFLLWDRALNEINTDDTVSARDMANKFGFNPKQIENTATFAAKKAKWNGVEVIDKAAICDAAYSQVSSNISGKATLIKKKHTWQELVMPKSQKEMIKQACNQIKFKHIVYDKWGMKNRILYGTGLSMLFTGPPGTGKTMAAQVVANELGLEIYKVDLSKVVSKYIGESEKNLGEVFENAKKSNVILLFDETDALFGKRTEVKDSHDKNANLETSYLLQKMEEYDGITIMTTNFSENIDKAFFRRINYVIAFSLPDADSRKEIWIKMYPKEMPLSKDIDFEFLAKKFEIAGGSIKNIALTSSFMAASESENVSMKHIVKALEYEIKKQGKMISKSDFGEYAYLV